MKRYVAIPSAPGYLANEQGEIISTLYWRGSYWRVLTPKGAGPKLRPTVALYAHGRRRFAYVARLVAEAFHGPAPAGAWCDHINGDFYDNRPQNLRWCTPAENNRNRRGVSGVSWRPDRGKWRAVIQVDGKQHSLGHYTSRANAESAYAEARREFHGEFCPCSD